MVHIIWHLRTCRAVSPQNEAFMLSHQASGFGFIFRTQTWWQHQYFPESAHQCIPCLFTAFDWHPVLPTSSWHTFILKITKTAPKSLNTTECRRWDTFLTKKLNGAIIETPNERKTSGRTTFLLHPSFMLALSVFSKVMKLLPWISVLSYLTSALFSCLTDLAFVLGVRTLLRLLFPNVSLLRCQMTSSQCTFKQRAGLCVCPCNCTNVQDPFTVYGELGFKVKMFI